MSVGKDAPTDPTNPMVADSWGHGVTSSSSNSQSESWRDPQPVWEGQSPVLHGRYQQGAGILGGERANALAGGATHLYRQARYGINTMMNPGVNPQMRAYSNAVGRDFNRNIMPGIQDNAAGFGQMGSSRQGVAEGIAAGEARQQMQDFGAQLYNQDRDRMMQAMALAPAIGQFGMSIPWFGLQQYAGLLGRPTVLGGAAGSTSSSSSSSHGVQSSGSHSEGGGGGGGGGGVNIGFPTG